jgi:RHS repeat-associated protein
MGRLSSERAVVQSPLVQYATEAGWTYIDPDEALRLRRGETNSIFWDTFGRRFYKSSSTGTTIYVYDSDDVIEELSGSGGLLSSYSQGLDVDEPLAQYQGAGACYFHSDGLGSIASLTNPAGAVAASYVYDSFGNLTASTGTVTNPFQYTGREFDPETGLYYYRARYYDPSVGRFISEDPIGFFSGTADFYAYVHNDATNLVDPFGLRACLDATKNCIQRALQALFPGVTASVGNSTQEAGGHWNFNVQLDFSSYDSMMNFYNAYWGPGGSALNGFYPPARFSQGPSLHLENLSPTGTWLNSNGTYTITGTAHIDLYNPNGTSQGGGGAGGVAGHLAIDVLIGHLVQALGSNIDPANCPW